MNVNTRVRAKRSTAARAASAVLAAASVSALAGCSLLPGAAGPASGGSGSGAVDFEGVQSATIQLEAQGTFVDPSYGAYEAAGRGSGFIIDEAGIAVTNNHVVVGAGTIDVWRGGDQSDTLNAKVLGASECLDLAVVELSGEGYPFLDWHEGDVTTGTEVYAAGFPLGEPEFTLTKGIVSKASANGETSWASVDSVIEHDARIRSGNSGGPLVDAQGGIVGVNYAGNDEYDYNFAIHRDEVLDVIEQLAAGEDVLSLGINGQALVDDEGNGVGIWVSSVAAGSIADTAGVEPGDLLTRLQGVSVGVDGTMSDYCDVLRTHGTDATLDVELYRSTDGLYYRGQMNGEAITAVEVIGGGNGEGAEGEFVSVTDDAEVINVEIPASWSDIDGAPFTDDSGANWASLMASPDLAGYQGTWDVPGVTIMASADAVGSYTPEALMNDWAASIEGSGCVSEQSDVYDDGYHVGLFQYWTGCGGAASYVVVAANSTANDYVVLVAVQANSDADLEAIDRVLGSFYAQF